MNPSKLRLASTSLLAAAAFAGCALLNFRGPEHGPNTEIDDQPSGTCGGPGPVSMFPNATWASSVIASSSTYPNFDAANALGAPTCFDDKGCAINLGSTGDCNSAWAVGTQSSGHEFIELGFAPSPQPPTRLLVYETYKPDSVISAKVTYDSGVTEVVSRPVRDASRPYKLLIFGLANVNKRPVKSVRLSLDQSALKDWTYIDAVGVM